MEERKEINQKKHWYQYCYKCDYKPTANEIAIRYKWTVQNFKAENEGN